MRSPAEFRPRLLARAAVLAIATAGLAACSTDTSRFTDNPFSSPLAARPAPAPSDYTASVPSGRIDAQQLPAPPHSGVASTGYPPPADAPRVASQAPKPAPANAGGRSRTAGGVHVVAPGETLTSIARLYGKSRVEVAKANKIDSYANVRVGQRLNVPGVRAAQPRTAPATQTATLQPPKQQAAKQQASAKVAAAAPATATARLATPASETPEAAAPAAAETTGAIPTFRWPVRGRVITEFGSKTNGARNDGINLSVPEGTSVKAAEDGVVAYAGNELKGYGNLVLVRHSGGYVTAYAHASDIAVKRGDQVKRGQIIARAGQTGNVSSPQLHFEIRKGSTPVDPMPHLSN
jgi:murein DD-endopeptidase MepM/ murein hydrolase activator NlpD